MDIKLQFFSAAEVDVQFRLRSKAVAESVGRHEEQHGDIRKVRAGLKPQRDTAGGGVLQVVGEFDVVVTAVEAQGVAKRCQRSTWDRCALWHRNGCR